MILLTLKHNLRIKASNHCFKSLFGDLPKDENKELLEAKRIPINILKEKSSHQKYREEFSF